MGLITIYRKASREEIMNDVPTAIRQSNKFLKEHPERQEVNIGLWYGKTFKIRRGHVKEDILKAAEESAGKSESSNATHIAKSVY